MFDFICITCEQLCLIIHQLHHASNFISSRGTSHVYGTWTENHWTLYLIAYHFRCGLPYSPTLNGSHLEHWNICCLLPLTSRMTNVWHSMHRFLHFVWHIPFSSGPWSYCASGHFKNKRFITIIASHVILQYVCRVVDKMVEPDNGNSSSPGSHPVSCNADTPAR